jgi:hypothetical protein
LGLAAISAVLATSACGSTVAMRSTVASGDGIGQTTPSGTSPGEVASQLGAAQTPSGTAGIGSSANDAPSSSSPQGAPPVAGSPLSNIPADPKKPIVVGVITSGNVGGFTQALGVNANFGDQKAQSRVIASYLNAHGGILGHKIQLIYYDFDASLGAAGNAQAACSAFTEDNHAVAAMGVAGMADAFHECAAKHGMFVLSDSDWKAASFFRKYPTTIEISQPELGREYRGMVLGLKEMGFFSSGARVGLVYTDDPNDVEAIRNGMKPALASIGLRVFDEAALSWTDPSQYYAQNSSTVLKFAGEGITHVLFGHAAAWSFAQVANKQRYYPWLGVDSRQSPAAVMQSFLADSPQSLEKVMGTGFNPSQDVDAAHDPGPVSANAKLCLKLYEDGGQGSGSSGTAATTGLIICDELLFLHDALANASDLSRSSFLGGVAGLGSRYQSPLTFATRFSATQHDGAQGYRPLRYKTDCSCFQYVGPVRLFS